MPLKRLLTGRNFTPEAVSILSYTFDSAISELKIAENDEESRNELAKLILEIASAKARGIARSWERQMTPAQCRAARALIEISQGQLAMMAVLPAKLVAEFEAGANLRDEDLDAIQDAFERAGVEIIERGVRLKA